MAELRLPREHGFWVMLAAVVLAALGRADFALRALLVTLGSIPLVISGAALIAKRVRRSSRDQLLASAVLPVIGVPIQLAAGLDLASILTSALALVVLFVASALVVRGAFARSRAHGSALRFDALAVVLTGLGCLGFAALGQRAEAIALGLGFSLLGLIVLGKPTTKRLKSVGLGLAGVAAVAAVALGMGG
jgi:hypothetical protein